jgi:hypothetical protein
MKRLIIAIALTLAGLAIMPENSFASGSRVHGAHRVFGGHGRKNPSFGPRHNRRVHKHNVRDSLRHEFRDEYLRGLKWRERVGR